MAEADTPTTWSLMPHQYDISGATPMTPEHIAKREAEGWALTVPADWDDIVFGHLRQWQRFMLIRYVGGEPDEVISTHRDIGVIRRMVFFATEDVRIWDRRQALWLSAAVTPPRPDPRPTAWDMLMRDET